MRPPADLRRFVVRTLLFAPTFPVVCGCVYGMLHGLREALDPPGPSTIHVWGDSRLQEGLDISLLSSLTGRDVRSYGTHGSGCYSLLAFTRVVQLVKRVAGTWAEVILDPDAGVGVVTFRNPSHLDGKSRSAVTRKLYHRLYAGREPRFSRLDGGRPPPL